MTSEQRSRRYFLPISLAVTAAVVFTGCTMEPEPLPVTGALIVGTTDEIGTLDPAGAADRGSLLVMANVYPHLLTTVAGSDEPVLDIAESAEFTSPTEYTVALRPGLTFANGHALTATDVKFSFDRITEIGVEGGPAASFEGVSGIEAVDEVTVVFTLSQSNDEAWPHVLASPAAAIVDEEVFLSNGLTDSANIVKGQPFAGQYVVETFREKELVQFRANASYGGVLEQPLSETVNLRYYGNPANLLRAVRDGDVDLATRGFTAENIEAVAAFDNLVVHTEPGGEIRFLAIDPVAAPFGSGAGANPTKALAVRQAIGDLVDRSFLVSELYAGVYEPLWSFAPASVREGEELMGLYGGADGAPDSARAKQRFTDADITPPVELSIHYSPESYGALAEVELDWVVRQLTQGGLFSVELVSEDEADFTAGLEGGIFPVFAFSYYPTVFDAEHFAEALFGDDSVLGERFGIPEVQELLATPTGGDTGALRADVVSDEFELLAERLPIVPLLQGNHVLIASTELAGVDAARAGSQLLRFATLSK